jgi:hypothetical protein
MLLQLFFITDWGEAASQVLLFDFIRIEACGTIPHGLEHFFRGWQVALDPA